MTERPILFSTPMVRAILEGRKTQTRGLATNRNAQKIKVGDVLWVRETFCESGNKILYKADASSCGIKDKRWRPSIYMPRKYCRILLKVKSVRTERLQDISEQDAKAEGVDIFKMAFMDEYGMLHDETCTEKFKALWNSINTVASTRWDDNPDIIRIEFEKVKNADKK